MSSVYDNNSTTSFPIGLLHQNKFIDINWELLLESSSSELSSINQLKVNVKITYLNTLTSELNNINMILTEKEFNELVEEINKLVKYF